MAVVLTSLTAEFKRTVFIKPPDMQRMFTAIPRAIVTFHILNGVIDAKPVNDQQELIIGLSVDSAFAYRWIDLAFHLSQDVAHDWNARGYLELTNAIRNLEPGMTQNHVVVFDDVVVVPGATERLTARTGVDPVVRYIIQVPPSSAVGSAPIITFKASNETAAVGAAGTCNFYASFYEYDIEQVEMYPTHYAQLTLHR